jgi:hypothetical protein
LIAHATINSIRVLVPGTGTRFRCGGLAVALQTARLLGRLRPTQVVTYRAREREHPWLEDLLAQEATPGAALWLVSWGFDVPGLLAKLRGRPVVYQAHSSGYGFDLPPGVPVVAVSRNTLGYWGDRAPRNPLFLVPNALEPQWLERGARPGAVDRGSDRRPIDVLVQQRKSSPYVLERLVPALREQGLTVEVQSGWVEDLVELFNSASVYLYDSAEYWRGRGVSEGFGLPPLEALACGCVVFSSFNHALADTLTPGQSAHQIGQGLLSHDVAQIQAAVSHPAAWRLPHQQLDALLAPYSESVLRQRWIDTLQALDRFFACSRRYPDETFLRPSPIWQERLRRLSGGVARRLRSLAHS